MTVPPTESGEGDPGQVTRIAEEFIRLHEAGKATDLDEFCARYPEDQRAHVRQECEQLLRIQGVIKQHDRLSAGQTLGSYEIVEAIGKGGMGEVYRARDPELDRDIAIKVLPPELACQPERVKRFKREAKAIAALDHPNIVTIHSVEESDGLHFITMQLVQGKTLSELIPKKGFSLEKFFDLAIPLADAISSAHEQGITHRDLKPANIMVTAEGRVEILDFGLAKLKPQVTAEGPTEMPMSSLTVEGQIVGTVAYMSPEQAEGREVDHRTDIFSLGIILYEMVTGERPFKGQSRVALMSSIMKDTPTPVTDLNASLPRHLGRIVRRCLIKDVRQRYQTATDVGNELTELRKEIDSEEMVSPTQPASGRRWLWPAVSGSLLVTLLLILIVPILGGGFPKVVRERQVTDLPGRQGFPSLSHDGEELLYRTITVGEIFWRPVAEGANPSNLTLEFDPYALHPAYSVDGSRIAFSLERDGGGIYTMGPTGDSVRPITDVGHDPSWSPDGEWLVYADEIATPYNSGVFGDLWKVRVNGDEEAERILTPGPDGERIDSHGPSWSPNGDWIAFWGRTGIYQRDIWVVPAKGGDVVRVTDDSYTDWGPFWSLDGQLLYFLTDRGGKRELWAVEMDEESGKPTSDPEPVWAPTGLHVTQAAISGDGSWIACTVELRESTIWRVPFNSITGQVEGEKQRMHGSTREAFVSLGLSPSGEYLAYGTFNGAEDVWRLSVNGGDLLNLTDDGYLHKDRTPRWYPNSEYGDWLTFHSTRGGGVGYRLFAVRPDGSGMTPLTDPELNVLGQTWWAGGQRLSVGVRRRFLMFLDGPTGGHGALQNATGIPVGGRASSAPRGLDEREVIAQTNEDNELWVFSQDRVINKYALDDTGERRRVLSQPASPWLDRDRLIFWDLDFEKAFLWNFESGETIEIEGIREPGQFVFSKDQKELFILQTHHESNVWLLEMSK